MQKGSNKKLTYEEIREIVLEGKENKNNLNSQKPFKKTVAVASNKKVKNKNYEFEFI